MIQKEFGDYLRIFGETRNSQFLSSRKKENVYIRMFFFKLMKNKYSKLEIAEVMEKNRSTMFYLESTFSNLYQTDPKFKNRFEQIEILFTKQLNLFI